MRAASHPTAGLPLPPIGRHRNSMRRRVTQDGLASFMCANLTYQGHSHPISGGSKCTDEEMLLLYASTYSSGAQRNTSSALTLRSDGVNLVAPGVVA